MEVTLSKRKKKKNSLETNSLDVGAYLEYLAFNNTTLEILVRYSILFFSFFRADWYSQHFTLEKIFI